MLISVTLNYVECYLADIAVVQASIGLVIFISFFLVAAVFEGNYGEDAIDDDRIY